MFPSTKPCLCKETNDSYSNTVMGILIVTLAITVGLSVLGVVFNAENGSQNDDFELPFIPEKIPLKELISHESSSDIPEEKSGEVSDKAAVEVRDVSVPEGGYLGCFDTEPGTLEVIEEVLPVDPLPLCIDDAYLANYHVIVRSIGGYSPKSAKIFLNQMKGDDCWEGVINADWTYTTVPGCPCAVDYTFTFSVDEPICLDSNHLPEGFDQTVTLDKWVEAWYCSLWEGCHEVSQEFTVILAHKAMSQKP